MSHLLSAICNTPSVIRDTRPATNLRRGMMSDQTKFVLQENEMPTAWYNIQADFDKPLPPVINPGTGQPIGPADLAPLFPMDLIMQEVGVGPYAGRFIDIPEEVQEAY